MQRVADQVAGKAVEGKKLEWQKLWDTAYVKNQNDQLPVVDGARRSALRRMKLSLAFCMASEHLFLA